MSWGLSPLTFSSSLFHLQYEVQECTLCESLCFNAANKKTFLMSVRLCVILMCFRMIHSHRHYNATICVPQILLQSSYTFPRTALYLFRLNISLFNSFYCDVFFCFFTFLPISLLTFDSVTLHKHLLLHPLSAAAYHLQGSRGLESIPADSEWVRVCFCNNQFNHKNVRAWLIISSCRLTEDLSLSWRNSRNYYKKLSLSISFIREQILLAV